MKWKSFIIILLLSGYFSFSQKQPVKISITYIEPYCGGARPSPEMEEKARTPQAYVKKTLFLVDAKGKTIKAKTDLNGTLNLKLKAGDYKLYEAWRHCKSTPDGQSKKKYSLDCLKTEWNKEFAVLNVGAAKSDYKETNGIYASCNHTIPCMLDSLRPSIPE